MVWQFNQCIECDRQWNSEDAKAGKWYNVEDWDVARWLCYRCSSRMWRKTQWASTHSDADLDHKLRTSEFKSDIQKSLSDHKILHPHEERHQPEGDVLMS